MVQSQTIMYVIMLFVAETEGWDELHRVDSSCIPSGVIMA